MSPPRIPKEQSVRVNTSPIGRPARKSPKKKTPPVRPLRENKLMQMEEDHPSCGDCLSPISRHASAAANRNSDKPSSLAPSKFVSFRGKRYGVRTQAISPGKIRI